MRWAESGCSVWAFIGEAAGECLDWVRHHASDVPGVVPVLKQASPDCKCSPGHLPLVLEIPEEREAPSGSSWPCRAHPRFWRQTHQPVVLALPPFRVQPRTRSSLRPSLPGVLQENCKDWRTSDKACTVGSTVWHLQTREVAATLFASTGLPRPSSAGIASSVCSGGGSY